jgi:hypothetical protein
MTPNPSIERRLQASCASLRPPLMSNVRRLPAAAAQMRSAVAESFPEVLLEPVSDYLVLPHAIGA